jgi:hypothetical protein
MFKYQLHKLSKGGKEARAVLLEDILTSDVFGVMNYFQYDLLLQPFLEQVRGKNQGSHFLVPPAAPAEVHFWKSMAWPESLPNLERSFIEPDVIIEWRDVLIIVEAKFISPTDPEELLREYLAGATQAFPDQSFFLLLIDKNLSLPSVSYHETNTKMTVPKYMASRILELDLANRFPPELISSSFLWVNWQSFYVLVERLIQKNAVEEMGELGPVGETILRDLLLILDRKGLIPFEVLSLEDFQRCEIDLNSLGQIGLMMRSSLSNLSDISIDVNALGRIGLILSDPLPSLLGCHLDTDAFMRLLPNRRTEHNEI